MIDANLNRAGEGLRVLEDVARFLLADAGLSERLRTLRHGLADQARGMQPALLSERDSENDVGARTGVSPQQDVQDVVTANARRVEESLRVLEELGRLPEAQVGLDSAGLQEARFAVYALERDLVSRIARRQRTERMPGLYVVLDRQLLGGRDVLEAGRAVIAGGASAIQLRDKVSRKAELLALAAGLRDICRDAGVLCIVNDYPDVAAAVDADGVHVGQGELPVPMIRRGLPVDRIVGYSVNTVAQAVEAEEQGADYVSVGSMFPTMTKDRAQVVGVRRLREVRRAVSCFVVAIGGVGEDNIGELIAAGADAVAVGSGVLGGNDVEAAARRLVARIKEATGGW